MSRDPVKAFAASSAAAMAKVRPAKAAQHRPAAEAAPEPVFSFDHLRGGDPAKAFAADSREAMAKVRPPQSTPAAERREPKV